MSIYKVGNNCRNDRFLQKNSTGKLEKMVMTAKMGVLRKA
jgi:hypothetical protein